MKQRKGAMVGIESEIDRRSKRQKILLWWFVIGKLLGNCCYSLEYTFIL